MKKKHKTRGGKREGAGNKPGVPLKPETKQRTIRKTYRFSQEEYAVIQDAVKVSGIEESKIVRAGALNEAQMLLDNNALADEANPQAVVECINN